MYIKINQKKILELTSQMNLMSDDELEKNAKTITTTIVNAFPFSFFNIIASKKMQRLKAIIINNTIFLDKYFKPNISTRCYYFINGLIDIKKCELETCRKPYIKQISPINTIEYFHCNSFCAQQDIRIKEKIDSTKTKNKTHTRDLLENTKIYNREHYGVDWFFQTDEFQVKKIETCSSIYGCKHHMQSEKIKKEMADRYEEKHGVRSPFQNPDVKEKTKTTNRKNLGCDYPSQNKELCHRKNKKSANTVKGEFYRNVIVNYGNYILNFF